MKGGRYLVTGGASGIGAAVRDVLVAGGASVIVVDLPERGRSEGAGEPGVTFVGADLGGPETAATIVVDSVPGPLDGLVFAAGVVERDVFPSIRSSEWNRVFAVNVTAPAVLTQALVGFLAPGSAIVSIASVESSTVVAPRGSVTPAYAASKGAVANLTANLAWELGPRGIRVNAVAPGLTRTPLAASIIASHGDWYASATPLRRVAEPREIASVVQFLLSDAAAFVTGQTLVVDGGFALGRGPVADPPSGSPTAEQHRQERMYSE